MRSSIDGARAAGVDRLDADVVRARVPVELQALADGALVAPGEVCIHEPVRPAASQVSLREPEAAPVVGVVLERDVGRERRPRCGARLPGIGLQQHHHLGAEQLARAQDAARLRRMLRRHAIGMRAVGHLGGQRQHLGAQRGEHRARLLRGHRRLVGRLAHGLEVGAHGRDRLAVGMAAHGRHHRLVGDSQPEEEPIARLLVETPLGIRHRHGVAGIDVGDARGDDETRGAREQPRRIDQHIAAAALGRPKRLVAALLEALREGQRLGRRKAVQSRPNAELAEVHVPIPSERQLP